MFRLKTPLLTRWWSTTSDWPEFCWNSLLSSRYFSCETTLPEQSRCYGLPQFCPSTALWFPESDDGYYPCFGTLPEILGLSPGFAFFITSSLLIIFLELKQKLKLSPISKITGRETAAPDYFFWLCLPLASGGQDLAAQGRDWELLSKSLSDG